MGNQIKDKKLTDDKEKLKTVPEDAGEATAEDEGPRRGTTRQEQLETPEILGEESQVGGGSRSGGRLAQEIGSRDELKRANERPGGATRVHKADERETARRSTRRNG